MNIYGTVQILWLYSIEVSLWNEVCQKRLGAQMLRWWWHIFCEWIEWILCRGHLLSAMISVCTDMVIIAGICIQELSLNYSFGKNSQSSGCLLFIIWRIRVLWRFNYLINIFIFKSMSGWKIDNIGLLKLSIIIINTVRYAYFCHYSTCVFVIIDNNKVALSVRVLILIN